MCKYKYKWHRYLFQIRTAVAPCVVAIFDVKSKCIVPKQIRPGEISRLWRAQLGARVFSSSEGKAITPTDGVG